MEMDQNKIESEWVEDLAPMLFEVEANLNDSKIYILS